jgi:hypothetical protein
VVVNGNVVCAEGELNRMCSSTSVDSTVYFNVTPGHTSGYSTSFGWFGSITGVTDAAPTGTNPTVPDPVTTLIPPPVPNGAKCATHEFEPLSNPPGTDGSATNDVEIFCHAPFASW